MQRSPSGQHGRSMPLLLMLAALSTLPIGQGEKAGRAEEFTPRMPPISRFMGEECLEASRGLSEEIETPWFLEMGGSFNQTSFIVAFSLYGCVVIVTFGLQIMVRFRESNKQDRKYSLKVIRWGSTFVVFSLWFFYDYVFMCARLNWLLTSADADFEPWGFPNGEHDGDVYVPLRL